MKLALAFALAALALPLSAARAGPSGLAVVARVPGPDGSWDYASFDSVHHRVFVAHGDRVLEIDPDSGALNANFAPGDHLHAVVPVPGTDVLVTTNSGDSSARILDALTGKLLASVPTAKDADGAVFDPSTGLVIVIDGDAGEATLVDPNGRRGAGSITIGDALEFPAVDGKGKLFVNVESKNEIAVVELASKKVIARYPLAGCQRPTGLAYVAGGRLVSACGNGVAKILDAGSGKEIASFKIGGFPDAVLYDPVRGLALIPSALSGDLAVISLRGSTDNRLIDTVPTQLGARTGAVDPKSGKVWLPTAQYILPAPPGQRPKTRPGTFQVLVLDRR